MLPKKVYKEEDFCLIRQVSGPQINPEGTKIAFTITDPIFSENKYIANLFIYDKNAGLLQINRDGSVNSNPIWSNDGKEIAYTSNIGGRTRIWKTNLVNVFSRPLDGVGENLSSLSYSPNSEKILFLSRVPFGTPPESDVMVIRRLPFKFDGLGFLHNYWQHLFVMDAKNGEFKQITEGEFNVHAASWNSDSRKIAYIANKDEKIKLTMKNHIWLIDSKTGENIRSPVDSRSYSSISSSPNGKWVAYIGNNEKYGLATKNDVFVFNTSTNEELNLTENFPLKVGDMVNGGTGTGVDPSPVWSPDSTSIYFITANRGNGILYNVNLEGKVEQVSDGERTIQSYSISSDPNLMSFLATDMVNPSEIWIKEHGEEKRITNINSEFIKNVQLIKGDMFTLKASDGVQVDGWFYKPTKMRGKKCPTILILKGGPHSSCWGNAFSIQAQILAANGYGVLYTNERGTGGYGEEFAKTARAKYYGERDYADLMEAVDYALSKYCIDGEKLGITGYSRGGFLTNWVISHTNRFKAAVTAGGFSDVYSFFGTSDEMHIWCEKNYEGTPWNDEELYMSKSPIRYVEKINTPTMIVHGQLDYRAPLGQAEQLYFALKRLGKEAELVIFPGESHSLPRRSSPKHMIEYQQHVMRWFKQHIPS